ncbi:MAG: M24 family metallopeptidase [Oscillospiraceae bacterium]
MPYGALGTDRVKTINYERMREYRLNRTKQLMSEEGLDVLISWEPWNIRYIASAYIPMATRWGAQQFLVLPRNGDPHLFSYTCYNTEGLREEMPWLKGKVWAAPEGGKLLTQPYQLEPFMKRVNDIIAEHGLTGGRVGLDACPNYYLYEAAFKKDGYSVEDPALMMFKARMIKNEDELACTRYACYAADAAFSAIQNAIRPGVKECELQAVGMQALYDLGADETMDFVVATGPRTYPLHIDFTDRIVRPGDHVVVDINGNSFNGYKSCYYRTFICGSATPEQKENYEISRKMMYDGMAQMRAGSTTDDVLDAWPSSPRFWGYDTDDNAYLGGHALAHGIGLSLHEYPMFGVGGPKGGRPPCVTFEEGMVIAIETIYGNRNAHPTYSARLEECVAITKDGYERFTKYPVGQLIECPL